RAPTDDRAPASFRILRFEEAGPNESAVTAHHHHEGRIGRRCDSTRREVDDGQALNLLDLGENLEEPLRNRVEVLVGEYDVRLRDGSQLAVGAPKLLEEQRVAVCKLGGAH